MRLLFAAMRDDVILDAIVDFAGKYAMLEEICLGAIRAETDDAASPAGRHAGDLEELFHAGVIDVDAIFGRWNGFGFWRGLRRVGLCKTRDGARAYGEKENQNRGEKHRAWLAELHTFIFCLFMGRRQEEDLTARGIYT